MNGRIPDEVRPYIDGHIASFYGSNTKSVEIEPYLVDVTWDGKQVAFSNLAHADATISFGKGTLKVVSDRNRGHIEIHTDEFDGKNGTVYQLKLPESVAARLKADGLGGFNLED